MTNRLRDAAKEITKSTGKLVVGAVEVTGTVVTEIAAGGLELSGQRQAAGKTRVYGGKISVAITTGTEFVVEKAAVPLVNMVANGAITTAQSAYKTGAATLKVAFAQFGSLEQKAAVQEALSGGTDLVIRAGIGAAVGVAVGTVTHALHGVDVDGHIDVAHVAGHHVHDYFRADGTHVSGYYRGDHLRNVGMIGNVSESVAERIAPTVAGWVAVITAPTPAANAADGDASARDDRAQARKFRCIQSER